MNSSHSRLLNRSAVVIVAGVIYYFLFTQLVGLGAAIAAPSWFVPFLREHQSVGLLFMSLVTHLPAIALGAAMVGYAMARLLPDRHFFFGVLTVCVMVLFSAIVAPDGIGFWVQLRDSVIPRYLFSVPTILALWLFLPLAAHLFGRNRNRGGWAGDAGRA